ncbi:glucose-1-phosphate cytidylyltransferase [Clostridium autoethanogenum]|uniref:Glucose-1-phosphate cytidylyltransferase n=1 Tax=Clostridium autoethanogenum TaxID=84023 RepID=A0A3M0T330_9CLOT|nr:glucose-1-phosphate cytidylyltransferase [Clostridium autoethanogenum]RMD04342.1 glucose-1-phosphate cytidylyltransferase [Clostridium autoethanogenum]
MKAVILAGGYGTRLSEETIIRPKPMVEIGGYPILWHIMKLYSYYNVNEFIICLGYKGYMIKEYFANYFLHQSDITFDMKKNEMQVHDNHCEPWKVTLVDTGEGTLTGGRLKRVKNYVGNETFCFTYGDGVSDVNIKNLIEFHNDQKKNGTIATLTAVNPPGRYGALDLRYNKVSNFKEKPQGEDSWINGGYFVLEPEIFDLIKGDKTSWELEPLEYIARNNKLAAFKHSGFWLPMDTLRDKIRLDDLWNSGQASWKVW